MAKRIRIGNDIAIHWSVLDQNGQPYHFLKPISVWLVNGVNKVKIEDFTIAGNVISLEFRGMDQRLTGGYDILFVENDNHDDMVSFDQKEIFMLVPHSWHETGTDAERVTTETIEVTSTIETGIAGRDGKSPYIGENGHWFEFNDNTREYEDTGIEAHGDKGDTPVITADEDGVLYADGEQLTTVIKDALGVVMAGEADRVAAESARALAESSREGAESARAVAEGSRVNAETARVNAEAGRVGAEESRVNAETGRANAETARVNAESARVNAESARANAEGQRASAETARGNAEATRVLQETVRVNAEAARVQAESARETRAGQDHNTAVADHQTAEADHLQAVADHEIIDTFAYVTATDEQIDNLM